MKKIIIYTIIFLLFNSCFLKTNKNQTIMDKKKIYVGMNFSDFKEQNPAIIGEETNQNRQYSFDEEFYGLKGDWSYDFKDGMLTWFIWDNYEEDITQENFDLTLAATLKLIEDYKKIYGEPEKYEEVDLTFKDPYKERHWGYDVIYAIWTTENMKIRIIFNFMGGKGMYNFLVQMDFHNADYEY